MKCFLMKQNELTVLLSLHILHIHASKMEGTNIYLLPEKDIGQFLARKFPIKDADLVIPVPDSARPAALGFAQEIGVFLLMRAC